eukprot:1561415-Prymnesium_polylepis.1
MSTDGPACIARTDPAMAGITGSGTATAGLPPHAAASCLASHAAFATSSDTNGAAGAAAIRTAGEGTGTDATGTGGGGSAGAGGGGGGAGGGAGGDGGGAGTDAASLAFDCASSTASIASYSLRSSG